MSDTKKSRGENVFSRDPITVGGIVISLLVSVGLVFFDVTDGILGFIIGLLITILSLLVQHMYDSRSRSELGHSLRASQWLRDDIAHLATASSRMIAEFGNTEITDEARARFASLRREITGLERGTIERAGDNYDDLLDATEKAKFRIIGVTNISQIDDSDAQAWWSGGIGKSYWKANLAAMDRGVTITRIFIYRTMNESLEELMRVQTAAGVEVRMLRSDDIEPAKHTNLTVWDGEKAWEPRMNARGVIVNNLFHLNSYEVTRLVGQFRACESASEAAPIETAQPA